MDEIDFCRKNFHTVWCDPSAPALIEDVQRLGIGCEPADNDVFTGIQRVKSRFKQGSLFIDQGCSHLLREIDSYSYEKDKSGKGFSEHPVKVDDHCVDALRYAVMGGGELVDFYFKMG
jgi:phage terminase large subunit